MTEETTKPEHSFGTKMAFLYPIIYLVAIIASALYDIYASGRDPVESFLFYTIILGIGLNFTISFFMHYFNGDNIARGIGWAVGSPFQKELAWASLGIGLSAWLCIWFSGDYWIAPVVAASVFLLGAAYGHIKEIVVNKNVSPGNAGAVLYMDIILPVAAFVLLYLHLA
ncbi:DUF6790 family protein [Patescibacteria group bacterium]